MLTPSEWSKLLLAKVLAQAIYDNENSVAGVTNGNNLDNCLVGSVLLLDDATVHHSEDEEGRLLRDLRRTGAAVVLSSNRWAIGRWADQIAVLKDGAIFEMGSHTQLLQRGPQHSIYATKWHAMTNF
jgi:ABC-type cobalamin transport system ATPase subunit